MRTPAPESAPTGPSPNVGAIVLAAGQSTRMGALDKIMSPLLERPLISHSLQVINDSPQVTFIVLVMPPQKVDVGRRLLAENGWNKVSDVCAGGERRQDSVRLGLERTEGAEWVIVHDGARPCVDAGLIVRGLAGASETGASAAAVPVTDTVKSAGADMIVNETVDRRHLWAVQTPQVFRTDLLRRAHRQISEDVTDDASMVERMGLPVKLFMGSYENVKVTTVEDLSIAEAILRSRVAKVPGQDR